MIRTINARWLWGLLLVPLALGLSRLRLDVEVLNLLPRDLPAARGLKLYQQHFADARELILTLEAPTPDEAESAAQGVATALRARADLVAAAHGRPPWLEDPLEATELAAYLWLNQSPEAFADLARRLAPTNLPRLLAATRARLATSFSPEILARARHDPFGLLQLPEPVVGAAPTLGAGEDLYVAPGGCFRLVFVEAHPDLTSYLACRTWLASIRAIVRGTLEAPPFAGRVRVQMTGRPAFVTEVAGGMEGDMSGSATGTLFIIGILFWLAHRRLRPLFWLVGVLLATLAGTAALGGLVLGTLNVVSLGFAAILLGLAEDYGILIYQESRSHPDLDAPALRRRVAPGIWWSALTTAGAFLVLNLSSLPGLGQLGTLVALGIGLAAPVMLYGFLPGVLRLRRAGDRATGTRSERFLLFRSGRTWPVSVLRGLTVGLVGLAVVALLFVGIRFDPSPNVLKPRHSEAAEALETLTTRFDRPGDPLWVLASGRDPAEVRQALARAQATLERAQADQEITEFRLPTAILPHPEHQAGNRATAAALTVLRPVLERAALDAGFTPKALETTQRVLDVWERAATATGVFWPTNAVSRHTLDQVVACTATGYLALGFVYPEATATSRRAVAPSWLAALQRDGLLVCGWSLLGTSVFDLVVREFPVIVAPILVLVLASLWLAFRNLRNVLMSLAALAYASVLLGAAMGVLGWSWNLLNLLAVPLLLGMGVDFGIHIQLALRQHAGDRQVVRASVGRALLLAGATTITAFLTLACSTNAGMASLGQVCALGIALNLFVAVCLLPAWWRVRGAAPRATSGSPD